MNIKYKIKGLDISVADEATISIEEVEVEIGDVSLTDIPAIIREVANVVKAFDVPKVNHHHDAHEAMVKSRNTVRRSTESLFGADDAELPVDDDATERPTIAKSY